MNTQEAELIRKRYQYRRLILRGKVSLPYRMAARLIGPDCAYHLYSTLETSESSAETPKKPEQPVSSTGNR